MQTLHLSLTSIALLLMTSISRCEDPPSIQKPVVGPGWITEEESIVLPSGIKAQARYHFNRNALSTICLTDDGLLALTDSGNLLRFDLKELQLQQETRPDAAYTRLIHAEGFGVAAADVSGRVFRIDPKTLKETEIAKLKAAPKWITGYFDASKNKHGILAAVTDETGRGEEIELHRLGVDPATSEKYTVPKTLYQRATIDSFFLDKKARLWLGKDEGEWGGWCGSVDLNVKGAGIVTVKDCRKCVSGFVELADGQVWAYGGLSHLSISSGFIARVDRGKLELLGDYGEDQELKPGVPPKTPQYPITHIIADPKSDGLLVFAFTDLFRVNAKLTNYQRLAGIKLRYRWGRPDAVGSYPALRTVIATKSGDLLCATQLDGLLRIQNGTVTQYVVPGQIGDDRISTILPAVGASLLKGKELWGIEKGHWRAISMFPPTQPDEHEQWSETCVMLDPERRPVAVCRTNWSPGAVALTRLKDGKLEVLASETLEGHSFSNQGCFATPDGNYWNANRDGLLRLNEGKWKKAGIAPEGSLWGFRTLGQGKPPWLLHCEGNLYRLIPGKGMSDSTLSSIPLAIEPGTINDALMLESGKLLLACKAGLKLYDVANDKLTDCQFAPSGEVRAVCKDGSGRIWLAGSSVWMVDAKNVVHDFAKLKRYGATAHVIGADSTDTNGVIVALGDRGVLFVRASADR